MALTPSISASLAILLLGFCVIELTTAQRAPTEDGCTDIVCKDQPNKSKHPHPYNCRKYYECRGASRHELDCPRDEVFDPDSGSCSETKMCELPCQQNDIEICGKRIRCLSLTEQREISHPSDCRLYFECTTGDLSLNICPNGQRFDTEDHKCEAEDEAVCVDGCNEPTAIPLPNTATPGRATVQPIVCNEPLPQCTVGSGLQQYPIPGDCSGYYQCDNGGYIKRDCAPGTAFDRVDGACISASTNVRCQERCSVDPVPNTTPTTTTIIPVITDILIDPEDSTQAETNTTPMPIASTAAPIEDESTVTTIASTPTTTAAIPEDTTAEDLGTPQPATPPTVVPPTPVSNPPTPANTKPAPVTEPPNDSPAPISKSTAPQVDPPTPSGPGTNPITPPESTTTSTVHDNNTPPGSSKPDDSGIIHQITPVGNANIVENTTATFSCHVVFPTNYDFSSGKDNVRMEMRMGQRRLRNSTRFSVFYDKTALGTDNTMSMTAEIKRMRRYNRVLTCQVYIDDTSISNRSLDIIVLRPPNVKISPLSVVASPGEKVTIACVVTNQHNAPGTALPEIYWYRDGIHVLVESTDRKSQLVLHVDERTEVMCIARNHAGSSNVAEMAINIIADKSTAVYCDAEISGDIFWNRTIQSGEQYQPCQMLQNSGELEGDIRRKCSYHDGKAEWKDPDYSKCTSIEFRLLDEEISRLEDAPITEAGLLKTASLIEEATDASSPLLTGDLILAVEAITKIAKIRTDQNSPPTDEEFKTLTRAGSNLLSEMNAETWENAEQAGEQSRAADIMETVDLYVNLVAMTLEAGEKMLIDTPNIYMMMEAMSKDDIKDVKFPDQEDNKMPAWMQNSEDAIMLDKETMESFKDEIQGDVIRMSGSYYRELDGFMPTKNDTELNSKIVSLTVLNLPAHQKMDPPINLEFTYEEEYPEDSIYSCSFWNSSLNSMQNRGGWSAEGCTTSMGADKKISCKCNHLTNFAILVSSAPANEKHHYVLSMISLIGCIISSVSLLLTMLFYCSMWKAVKSHHAAVLLNLCIALLIGNILFIGGVQRTENKMICTIIAALLHYFWLAAFFIMLVEGIQLLLYIIYVFHVRRKRDTGALLFGGWMFPAVVVGITLAITQMEGYGNEDACWLSTDSGLLWAFVAPVLVIIFINLIILIIVLRRAMSAKIPSAKKKNKLRSAVWNILVITPLLGITWVLGVFSVNEDTIMFQYFFTVSNSLQGLFIFIFHALCNKKLREAASSSGKTSSTFKANKIFGKKGRYAMKETTPSKSKRSPKNSTGQNSNKSNRNNVNGNVIKQNGTGHNGNDITKIDLHSAPSYDLNGTFSTGKNPGYQQQLSDGSEFTVQNSAPSRGPSLHEPVGKKPSIMSQPPRPDELNHLSVRTTVPENKQLTTFNIPTTEVKSEIKNKPLLAGRQTLMSTNSSESGMHPVGEKKNSVTIAPIKVPVIDTTNLMSSPDWAEMVQYLPDDVAHDIISSSRPEGEQSQDGFLMVPPIDSRNSLSSTPTRIESDQLSLASSILRDDDTNSADFDDDVPDEELESNHGNLRHTDLNKSRDGLMPEDDMNDEQYHDADNDTVITDIVSLTSLSLSEHRPHMDYKGSLRSLNSKLSLASTPSKQENHDQPDLSESFDPPLQPGSKRALAFTSSEPESIHSQPDVSESFDPPTDVSESFDPPTDVSESFDPPPRDVSESFDPPRGVSESFDPPPIDVSESFDPPRGVSESFDPPPIDVSESFDPPRGVSESFDPPPADYYPYNESPASTLTRSHTGSHQPETQSLREHQLENESSPPSHQGSVVSIINVVEDGDKSQRKISQGSKLGEKDVHQDDPPEPASNQRRPPQVPAKPKRDDPKRTSSFLPPMPTDASDSINYRQSIEFPPPPSTDELWSLPTEPECTVHSDGIPLVSSTPSDVSRTHKNQSSQNMSAKAKDFGVDNRGYVVDRPQNEYHRLVDNRASIASTLPPSPTTTTTDISWTSERDLFNSSFM